MSQFVIYAKGLATAVAGLYAVAFVVFNARRTAEVWLFFGADLKEAPTFVVIAITAVLSVVLAWLLRQLLGWRWRRRDRARSSGTDRKS
jgi:ABC-type nickel/cobalt efflux system permease component RcnA